MSGRPGSCLTCNRNRNPWLCKNERTVLSGLVSLPRIRLITQLRFSVLNTSVKVNFLSEHNYGSHRPAVMPMAALCPRSCNLHDRTALCFGGFATWYAEISDVSLYLLIAETVRDFVRTMSRWLETLSWFNQYHHVIRTRLSNVPLTLAFQFRVKHFNATFITGGQTALPNNLIFSRRVPTPKL